MRDGVGRSGSAPLQLGIAELVDLIRRGRPGEELSYPGGAPLVFASLDGASVVPDLERLRTRAAAASCVLVGIADGGPDERALRLAPLFDVLLTGSAAADTRVTVRVRDIRDEVERIATAVFAHPIAAITTARLLRRDLAASSLEEALVAESAAYSALQAGPEFAAWLALRGTPRRSAPPGPAVRSAREGGTLRLTLSLPEIHNAYTVSMRDGLCEALAVADVDASITRIVLEGAGPSFCSGGYLDEFGTLPDPATAHLVRLSRSAGRLLAWLAERVEVRVHGATIGAGIELAAYASRVVADPGVRIALPELALGLLPGAGGTVSLPRRIGRQRTAYLALTGAPIDATTAREWGLVDEICPRGSW